MFEKDRAEKQPAREYDMGDLAPLDSVFAEFDEPTDLKLDEIWCDDKAGKLEPRG